MIPYRSFTTRDVKLCVSRSKCGTAGPHIIYWLLVVHGVVDKSSPVWWWTGCRQQYNCVCWVHELEEMSLVCHFAYNKSTVDEIGFLTTIISKSLRCRKRMVSLHSKNWRMPSSMCIPIRMMKNSHLCTMRWILMAVVTSRSIQNFCSSHNWGPHGCMEEVCGIAEAFDHRLDRDDSGDSTVTNLTAFSRGKIFPNPSSIRLLKKSRCHRSGWTNWVCWMLRIVGGFLRGRHPLKRTILSVVREKNA